MDIETLRKAVEEHYYAVLKPYDAIIKLNGFDAVCAVCDLLGGATVYIPSKNTVFKKCVELAILREYDGTNGTAVRRKYGYTDVNFRKLMRAES